MDNILLKNRLEELEADAGFPANPQYLEVVVPDVKYHDFCVLLKTSHDLLFDYLISMTAVDWNDHFMVVSHITSTRYRHTLVVKTRLNDREEPVVETVSDIWKTAEYHEREVFDLFGIRFRHHPDLRRLFLEDDYGYPLRKDFADESRMIVK
jgi:NADH:ubiquinone oxidoreductase subunit C